MLVDETLGDAIASRAVAVRGLVRQAFGLMFRKRLVDEAWVFEQAGVTDELEFEEEIALSAGAVDVLWLDADRVVLQKRAVRSWQWKARGVSGAEYLIELPAGAAGAVLEGHVLSWKYDEKKRF